MSGYVDTLIRYSTMVKLLLTHESN